tara:strand:- start:365 stop:601 length:237 start_codon:yes stop_codon:yes gene_type:complete
MSRKYIILDTSELSGLDFSQLKTTSINSSRKSLDGTKAIVSYEGATPDGLSGKTEYTNSQLLPIVTDMNGEWSTDSLL